MMGLALAQPNPTTQQAPTHPLLQQIEQLEVEITLQIAALRRAALAEIAQQETAQALVVSDPQPQLVSIAEAAEIVFAASKKTPKQKQRSIASLIESNKLAVFDFSNRRIVPGRKLPSTGELFIDLNEARAAVKMLRQYRYAPRLPAHRSEAEAVRG